MKPFKVGDSVIRVKETWEKCKIGGRYKVSAVHGTSISLAHDPRYKYTAEFFRHASMNTDSLLAELVEQVVEELKMKKQEV